MAEDEAPAGGNAPDADDVAVGPAAAEAQVPTAAVPAAVVGSGAGAGEVAAAAEARVPVAAVPGRARDLVRRRSRVRTVADTGRQHHLGGAPAGMPVLGPEGASRTRTAAVQLADRTVHDLERLGAELAAEMERAAAAADYETAAARRDELVRVHAELARRP